MKIPPRDPASVLVVDGRRIGPGVGALRPDLPGILRGEGIFESFLVVDGAPSPFLPEHDARLRRSAELMGMDLGGRGLVEDLPAVLAELGPGTWRARYTVLRGADGGLVRIWIAGEPTPPPEEIVLALSPFRLDPADPLAGAKTVSRAGYQRARALAAAAGAWEALMPTVEGDLGECTSANVFVWTGAELLTPPADRGILLGVTRGGILAGALRAGIPARERKIAPSELEDAVEVLVTNAVIGVIPVRKILGFRVELPGASGSALERIRSAYREQRRHAREAGPLERSILES